MGIYDREYYQGEEEPGVRMRSPQSVTLTLILINAGIYVVDVLFSGDDHWISNRLSMQVSSLTQPWMWWQALTSGFVHDPGDFFHVGANMVGLWFFGRPVEQRLGKAEFLRLYLTLIVVASFCWALFTAFNPIDPLPVELWPLVRCMGASGAVAGIVILFALYYPHATILLFFVIPMRAWIAGLLLVGLDLLGSFNSDSNIAHSAHLAGIAFAFAYHRWRWNLGRFLPSRLPTGGGLGRTWGSRPNLRIHQPEDADDKLSQEADRVLAKLHREGEASLTRKERRILEEYSRKMRERQSG